MGVRFPGEARNFSLLQNVCGPPSLQFSGWGVLARGVKQPGCATDHLPPFSTEFKNKWSCTSAPVWRAEGKIYFWLLVIQFCRILSVEQFVHDQFNIIMPSVVTSISGSCFAHTVEDIAI
jgi:hypothetical protein